MNNDDVSFEINDIKQRLFNLENCIASLCELVEKNREYVMCLKSLENKVLTNENKLLKIELKANSDVFKA